MIERTVLWAAAVRTKPLQERLSAAAAAGFSHLSVFPVDMAGWRSGGMSDRQIRRAFVDAGVAVATVDPFVQWSPGFDLGVYADPADRAFVDHDEDAVFAMVEALGTDQLNLVSGVQDALDPDASANALSRVQARAAREGVRLTLEFMPISNIPNLATALDLLDRPAAAGVSLVFDTWHFFRSDPDLGLLAKLDGARVAEVQLADAASALVGDLMSDLQHHRRVPGEGDFDLAAVVAVLRRIGAWRSVGPEIFSDEMDALDAGTAARRARTGLDRLATEASATAS